MEIIHVHNAVLEIALQPTETGDAKAAAQMSRSLVRQSTGGIDSYAISGFLTAAQQHYASRRKEPMHMRGFGLEHVHRVLTVFAQQSSNVQGREWQKEFKEPIETVMSADDFISHALSVNAYYFSQTCQCTYGPADPVALYKDLRELSRQATGTLDS